ncbi:MAG: multidrug transporter AcrB [Caulobacterales bacterium 32-69-10]|nr:MAG: multidrug transporter AcrB [Caulobacterales bacterium 32-69-10]
MTISDLAVRRPVFALVVAMIMCIVGLVSFSRLPLRELPNVDPPQVSISTNYTGASAEVIETRITQPIERQVSGIAGIDRLSSTSRDGRSFVNIQFTLDRDLEEAANDVRDRVSRVMSQLPTDLTQAPTVAKANADGDPIITIMMGSTTMTRMEMTDYIVRYLQPRLATVDGVANVGVFGQQQFSMRVWLDAAALAAHNLSVDDVTNALSRNNVQLPAGTLQNRDTDYTINVERSYSTPAEFSQMPITVGRNNYVVRLGDVARVEEAPDERRRLFRANGEDKIGMGVIRQSDANDLKISDGVHAMMDDINKTLPKGTKLELGYDNSTFTREAVSEVWMTMGIAVALVAAVNFLFLGSWQAALIPTIVAPICILSTFIILAPLGFSLNLLTLLALVLAIGLVVDDAIVVTENIQRRIDEGEPPVVAAERGARQVFFAVLATTATLISVFTPLMFLPGYIGRLFVELAVAIAGAVAVSAFLALTFSPVLAAKLLRPAQNHGWLASRIDKGINKVRESYRGSLDMLLGRRLSVVAALATIGIVGAAAGGLFVMLPQEVVPEEDRGRVDMQIVGPEGAGFDYMTKQMNLVAPVLQRYVDKKEGTLWILVAPGFGGGTFNSGNGNLKLAEWNERDRSAQEIAAEINRETRSITGARVSAGVRSAIQRGPGGGNAVQLIATGPEYEPLAKWVEPIMAAARDNPGFSRVNTNYDPVSPRVRVTLDRDRAGALGVTAQQVGLALNTFYGPRRVGTYVRAGQEYDVLLQTNRENRRTLENLSEVYVRAATGSLVPLSQVVKTELRGDLAARQRIDQQRAVTLTMIMNPGYTVVDAVKFLEGMVAKQPPGPIVQWGGQAKDLQDSGNAVIYAFGFALVVVFLVLAAQFESFVHPAIIMLTVPLAAAGGLFGLLMAGSTINLYSEIGLIILIGIAAKNGILIVEFANQLRDEGLSVREAVIESAQLRLRPIVMTSIASAAVAVPLVMAHGPGSNSRYTIGAVIISGSLFSTLLTLFIVPVMYELLARFTKSPEYTARQIEAFEEQEKQRLPTPQAPGGIPEAAE